MESLHRYKSGLVTGQFDVGNQKMTLEQAGKLLHPVSAEHRSKIAQALSNVKSFVQGALAERSARKLESKITQLNSAKAEPSNTEQIQKLEAKIAKLNNSQPVQTVLLKDSVRQAFATMRSEITNFDAALRKAELQFSKNMEKERLNSTHEEYQAKKKEVRPGYFFELEKELNALGKKLEDLQKIFHGTPFEGDAQELMNEHKRITERHTAQS